MTTSVILNTTKAAQDPQMQTFAACQAGAIFCEVRNGNVESVFGSKGAEQQYEELLAKYKVDFQLT